MSTAPNEIPPYRPPLPQGLDPGQMHLMAMTGFALRQSDWETKRPQSPIVVTVPAEFSSKTVVIDLMPRFFPPTLDKPPYRIFNVKHTTTAPTMRVTIPPQSFGLWLRAVVPPSPVPRDYVITFQGPTTYPPLLPGRPSLPAGVDPNNALAITLDPLPLDKPTAVKVLSMFSDKLVIIDVPPTVDSAAANPPPLKAFTVKPTTSTTPVKTTITVPSERADRWLRVTIQPSKVAREVNLTFQPPTPPPANNNGDASSSPAATTTTAATTTMKTATTTTTPQSDEGMSPAAVAAIATVGLLGVAAVGGAVYYRKMRLPK